jgi:hypothetical protein
MKQELLRLIRDSTLADVKEGCKKTAAVPRKTHAAAISIKALVNGKANMFLQYIQLELDKKDKKQVADFIALNPISTMFKIEYKGSNQMSIGNLLREKLNYYNDMTTSDFYQIRLEDSTPTIDCVAYSMLKHSYVPSVLNKVLAIFDIIPPDDVIEIQVWEPNESTTILPATNRPE